MIKNKIIIVDNEPLILDLIKEMLDEEAEFEVSHITATKEGFMQLIEQHSLDVAVVDISIGEREDGIDILQLLEKRQVKLPTIVLSAHSEIDYALKCLQAGAKGYINKSQICSSLLQALKTVCSGDFFIAGERGPDILKKYKKSLISPR